MKNAGVSRIRAKGAGVKDNRVTRPDYRRYVLSVREKAAIIALYEAGLAVAGLLFYDSLLLCALCAPFAVFVLRMAACSRCAARQRRLNSEFKELLTSLSASMAAGCSIESAFAPAYAELQGIYQGRSLIEREVLIILRGLEMSADIEQLLGDLAARSGVEDIREFAGVVAVAKGSGGNLIQMMKRMVENIDSRLEVEDEIDTMVTSKRLEQNIMSAMPFAIIMYLRVCNKGYMDVMYGNVFGVVVMTVCLAVTALTVVWGRRIIDIRV